MICRMLYMLYTQRGLTCGRNNTHLILSFAPLLVQIDVSHVAAVMCPQCIV